MGNEFDDVNGGDHSAPGGGEYNFTAPRIGPADAAADRVDLIAPADIDRNIAGSSRGGGPGDEDMGGGKEPLRVGAVKDIDLTSFEKKTIRIGWLGFGVAALSLVAAIVVGIVFFLQFREMKRQTGVLSDSFEKQKEDSADASVATAKQIAIMQGQLTQAQYSARLDQRAWIEFEPIKPKPYKDSTEFHTYELFPKNTGKTAARDIVVRANNVGTNRQSIENTRHPGWIHNMQDRFLFGKFKNNPPLNGGTPVPSVLGPGTVSPIPITYITQIPQSFPSGSAWVSEILGRVDYTDEFGVPHWIRFCFYPADADGDLASCAAGNDEDYNPEIPRPKHLPKPN
jgi:hypothetical protein